MKRLLLVVLCLILAIVGVNATTIYNITISSSDNSTELFFDSSVFVSSLGIGTDWVALYNIQTSQCANIFSYNFTTSYNTSHMNELDSCLTEYENSIVIGEQIISDLMLVAVAFILIFIILQRVAPSVPAVWIGYFIAMFGVSAIIIISRLLL